LSELSGILSEFRIGGAFRSVKRVIEKQVKSDSSTAIDVCDDEVDDSRGEE
jgi:hypothetical protein